MVLLTQYNGSILGPIAKVLGWIFNGLFELTSNFGIQNIGLCIILFTVVVKLLMLPLTVKQMKFSKLSSVMQPELAAIQKKYSGKTDQDSALKMNEETKKVYAKYGVSPTGGCLQMLIQLPILFALYRVMQNIPAYVSSVKDLFVQMLTGADNLIGNADFLAKVSEIAPNFDIANATVDTTIDAMNMFNRVQWDSLIEAFPSIANNVESIHSMYDFFGINLAVAPEFALSVSLLIPILTAVTQWISMKTVGNNNPSGDSDNPAMQSMKMMNTIMPLMTAFIAFSLPSALGLYWIATAVCQTIQQLLLNVYFNKIDMNKLIEKNIEKSNAKRAKQGLAPYKTPGNISVNANTNAKNIQEKLEETRRRNLEKVEEIRKSSEYYNDGNSKKGSLSSKANMVSKYNEKHSK